MFLNKSYYRKLAVLVALQFIDPSTGYAETYSKKWLDLNYVTCQGIGFQGTGLISADMNALDSGNFFSVSSLKITATREAMVSHNY